MNYTMFVFKQDGPTKVHAESDKLEKFTDIVLDGSYLTFKGSFRQLGFFSFWYRIEPMAIEMFEVSRFLIVGVF